ncbi:MAG: DinB family protein [Acidobacteria bacterium]|nr:DinB family protein [Acidobacteriota bacterium]
MALSKKAQEVVDYMTAEREKFIATANGLSDTQINFKSAEDQWSIRDIFHHIWMVEGLTAKLMANLLQQAVEKQLPADPDPEASMLNSLEAHAESWNRKFQAPERVVPLEAVSLTESIAKMGETRTAILAPLDELCRYDVSSLLYPHPALGPINVYQWLVLMGAHEARHGKQIERIKADALYPAN